MSSFFKEFSDNKGNELIQQLRLIAEHNGVVDCALFDQGGRCVHQTSGTFGKEGEVHACFDYVRQICGIGDLYTRTGEQCENIHLYCTGAEILLWDFGPLIFMVIGKDIANVAEIRLRANIFKNSINADKKLKKYFSSPAMGPIT